jgi:hypothetical protein
VTAVSVTQACVATVNRWDNELPSSETYVLLGVLTLIPLAGYVWEPTAATHLKATWVQLYMISYTVNPIDF